MIYALTSILLNALAQLAIKNLTENSNLTFRSLVQEPWMYLVALLYIMSIGLWFEALKHLSVSKAYPLQSLGYIFVTIMAAYFYSEKIAGPQIVGLIFICFGAFLVSL